LAPTSPQISSLVSSKELAIGPVGAGHQNRLLSPYSNLMELITNESVLLTHSSLLALYSFAENSLAFGLDKFTHFLEIKIKT